jgi:hypothetical protein
MTTLVVAPCYYDTEETFKCRYKPTRDFDLRDRCSCAAEGVHEEKPRCTFEQCACVEATEAQIAAHILRYGSINDESP